MNNLKLRKASADDLRKKENALIREKLILGLYSVNQLAFLEVAFNITGGPTILFTRKKEVNPQSLVILIH